MFASRFGGKPLLTLPALTNSLLGIGGLIMLLLLWWLGTDVLASSEGFIRQFSPTGDPQARNDAGAG
jgi:NitT/TauT family transport system permease protein